MSEERDKSESQSFDWSKAFLFPDWLVLVLLVGLATHGLVTILEGCGIIVWYDGAQHFWFEDDVRRWIHNKPEAGE